MKLAHVAVAGLVVLLATSAIVPMAAASDDPCKGQAPGPHCRPPCDDPNNGCLGILPEVACLRLGPVTYCP